jgi:hypothetical protein
MYTFKNMHINEHLPTISGKNVLSSESVEGCMEWQKNQRQEGKSSIIVQTSDYEVLTITCIPCMFWGFQSGIFENTILLECSATSLDDGRPMFPGHLYPGSWLLINLVKLTIHSTCHIKNTPNISYSTHQQNKDCMSHTLKHSIITVSLPLQNAGKHAKSTENIPKPQG